MGTNDRPTFDFQETANQIHEANNRQLQWLRENLSYARERFPNRLKDEHLATLTGLGARTVGNFFSGTGNHDIKTVLGLTHALGLRLHDAALPPEEFRRIFEGEPE